MLTWTPNCGVVVGKPCRRVTHPAQAVAGARGIARPALDWSPALDQPGRATARQWFA